jgi:hypothetical protein
LVHVGITAVVHQAARQIQTQAQLLVWRIQFSFVIDIRAVDGLFVEFGYQAELQDDGSTGQPLRTWDVEDGT